MTASEIPPLSGTEPKTVIALSPPESFAAILLLIVAADGQLTASEASLLEATLGQMHLFRGYPADFLPQTVAKLCQTLRVQGQEALLMAALASLPRDLYDTTYAIALDLALVDADIGPEEQQILDRLQAATGLQTEVVELLQWAMTIKHKG